MECANEKCANEFSLSPHASGKQKKFCSPRCRINHFRRKYYYETHRHSKIQCEKQTKHMKRWYQKNKAKQNETTKANAKKNRKIWTERSFTFNHRNKIILFLPKECPLCNRKSINVLHHIQYGNQPALTRGYSHREENLELIKKYTKKNIVGFCSQQCHRRFERKQASI